MSGGNGDEMGEHKRRAVATPPAQYAEVIGAPRGLRQVMKAGEITRAVQAVREWRELEQRIQAGRVSLVDDLRGRGASWDTVGWVLGTTGEGVRRRYGGRRT